MKLHGGMSSRGAKKVRKGSTRGLGVTAEEEEGGGRGWLTFRDGEDIHWVYGVLTGMCYLATRVAY
jgi:hypothetical protein